MEGLIGIHPAADGMLYFISFETLVLYWMGDLGGNRLMEDADIKQNRQQLFSQTLFTLCAPGQLHWYPSFSGPSLHLLQIASLITETRYVTVLWKQTYVEANIMHCNPSNPVPLANQTQ